MTANLQITSKQY